MNNYWTENLYNHLCPRTVSGTTDIDISAYVYTSFVTLLTIEPRTPIRDMVIYLDFDKETTGVNDVATNADTLDAQVFTKVDGSIYVAIESMTQKTLTGTFGLAVGGGWVVKVPALDVTQDLIIKVKLSAERADAEVPYRIVYCSEQAPTVTAVAA